jgi:hypothetical protein
MNWGKPNGGVEADRGTAAHKIGELALTQDKPASAFMGSKVHVNGTDWLIDEDFIHPVQVYLDAIREDLKEMGSAATMKVEQALDLEWVAGKPDFSWLHGGNLPADRREEMGGTSDCVLGQSFGLLRIYDYKNGAGTYVEVEENAQFLGYAAGVLGENNPKEYSHVEMVVVQPRYGSAAPVRRWRVPVSYVYDWVNSTLRPGIERAQSPTATCIAGEWCAKYFCSRQHDCEALRKYAFSKSCALLPGKMHSPRALPDPSTLSPEKLNMVFEASNLIAAWVKSVKEYAYEQVKLGRDVAGLKLVNGKSSTKWVGDEAKVIHQLRAYGIPDEFILSKPKLRTAPQVRDAIKKLDKGIQKAVAKNLTQTSRGVTVALASDKRPAINSPEAALAKANSMF